MDCLPSSRDFRLEDLAPYVRGSESGKVTASVSEFLLRPPQRGMDRRVQRPQHLQEIAKLKHACVGEGRLWPLPVQSKPTLDKTHLLLHLEYTSSSFRGYEPMLSRILYFRK